MKDKKVEELVKRVAAASFERGVGYLADFYDGIENIPAELLDKQWDFEIHFAEYQLNDPDLALIDTDQTAPCTELHENSPPNKGMITQDYLNGRKSIIDAGFKKVIPLAKALKESPPKTLNGLFRIDPNKDIVKSPKGYSV